MKLPFLKLIKRYGIVGEKELGIYFKDDEDETDILNQAFPGIIMIHIIQSGEYRFTNDEIDLYYKQGYLPKTTMIYMKNSNYDLGNVYKKTSEMIQRGAPEDSITMQVRVDWKASQND